MRRKECALLEETAGHRCVGAVDEAQHVDHACSKRMDCALLADKMRSTLTR